jgi:hypothetical protein
MPFDFYDLQAALSFDSFFLIKSVIYVQFYSIFVMWSQ